MKALDGERVAVCAVARFRFCLEVRYAKRQGAVV